MGLKLGIDTGGTFTDAALLNDRGEVVSGAKALTSKHDLRVGIDHATTKVLDSHRGADIELVCLSTTLATNAVVEGHGGAVCLILIGQKPNALGRAGLGNLLAGDPVIFVAGGHTATGDEQQPLDEPAIVQAVQRHAGGVSAFAVAGFFAVRNPDHEERCRNLIESACDRPVTCSHDLSARLDAPRRALTTVLNARLIADLADLVDGVESTMSRHGIVAPVMVVQGDGSLVRSGTALRRPVQTILSGPAASVVGARHLAGVGDAIVSDIGGTTTDIAVLRGGQPGLDTDGARIGGWQTMVEAVRLTTVGLGGDSEVRLTANDVAIGPQRALPVSLLGHQHRGILDVLNAQLGAPVRDTDGRFALRLRSLGSGGARLTRNEQKLWDALAGGPVDLETLFADPALERALERMRRRGLVIVSSLTPSDCAHVLGLHHQWNGETAEAATRLMIRQSGRDVDTRAFCDAVKRRLEALSARALVQCALTDQAAPAIDPYCGDMVRLIDSALANREPSMVDIGLTLATPVVGIGAPAHVYYPAVAGLLGTTAIVPPHAEVCNAVGAAAAGVVRKATALITGPEEDIFRVHTSTGIRDFSELEPAAQWAAGELGRILEIEVAEAGGRGPSIEVERHDRIVNGFGGRRIFIESRLDAVATASPAHLRHGERVS